MQFSEQVVVVTGAGRGLGAHIAQAFLDAGACVVVNYRSSAAAAKELAARAGEGSALAVQADVTNPIEVAAMFATAEVHFGTPRQHRGEQCTGRFFLQR